MTASLPAIIRSNLSSCVQTGNFKGSPMRYFWLIGALILLPLRGEIPLDAKIYVAGHRGLVGSAIVRKLESEGYTNLVTRTSRQLDLRVQSLVQAFFEQEK